MGHKQELVIGVEGDQRPAGQAPGDELLPTVEDEYSCQEILFEDRVVQAALFLDGEQGHALHQDPGKDPSSLALSGTAFLAVDLDLLHAAARRVLFEDVTADLAEGRALPARTVSISGSRQRFLRTA